MADFKVLKDWLLQLLRSPASAAALAVALSGLVSSMAFLVSFEIPVHLYLGAFDLIGLAVRSAPSVLAAFMVVALLAFLFAGICLAGRGGVLLGALLAGRVRPSARPRTAGYATTVRVRCRDQIHAWRDPVALLNRVLRSWRLLTVATLATTAIGSGLSHYAAVEVMRTLAPKPGAGADADDPFATVVSRLTGGVIERSGPVADVFRALYVNRHLRPVALSLASTDRPVEGLVVLGANATYAFFYDTQAQHPLIVPNEQIEAIAQSELLPAALRRVPVADSGPEPDAAERTASALEAIGRNLEAVAVQTAAREPAVEDVVARVVETMSGVPAPCQAGAIEGARFRFAVGSAAVDAGALLDDIGRSVAEHNRDALAAVGRYVKAAGGIDPGDFLLIVGRTDLSGGVEYNARLAERRAKNVARVLGDRIGLSSEMLRPVGLGELPTFWLGDPEGERSRHVQIYHCRRGEMPVTGAEEEVAAMALPVGD